MNQYSTRSARRPALRRGARFATALAATSLPLCLAGASPAFAQAPAPAAPSAPTGAPPPDAKALVAETKVKDAPEIANRTDGLDLVLGAGFLLSTGNARAVALTPAPRRPAALVQLGEAYAQDGRWEAAATAFEEALARPGPAAARAWRGLATARAALGDAVGAQAAGDRALALSGRTGEDARGRLAA